MKTTILGSSGLRVSRIAFGTWQLGGDWGRFDEAVAVTAIRRALSWVSTFSPPRRPTGSGRAARCQRWGRTGSGSR